MLSHILSKHSLVSTWSSILWQKKCLYCRTQRWLTFHWPPSSSIWILISQEDRLCHLPKSKHVPRSTKGLPTHYLISTQKSYTIISNTWHYRFPRHLPSWELEFHWHTIRYQHWTLSWYQPCSAPAWTHSAECHWWRLECEEEPVGVMKEIKEKFTFTFCRDSLERVCSPDSTKSITKYNMICRQNA